MRNREEEHLCICRTEAERWLLPNERLDDLERNGLFLIQDLHGFRFGMDAVLLSGFASVRAGEQAVDLGTGSGIIPILLSAKTRGERFYALEIDPEAAQRAARSVLLNHLEQRVTVLCGDLKELLEKHPAPFALGEDALRETKQKEENRTVRLLPGQFQVVTSNPPYMKAAHGLQNPSPGKAAARHEVCCSLTDVCMAAARLLQSGGRFYMVHRPQRLAELIAALKAARLEPKRIRMVHPFADREANMVLIESVRGGREGMRVEAPLIIFEREGVYTPEITEVYGY